MYVLLDVGACLKTVETILTQNNLMLPREGASDDSNSGSNGDGNSNSNSNSNNDSNNNTKNNNSNSDSNRINKPTSQFVIQCTVSKTGVNFESRDENSVIHEQVKVAIIESLTAVSPPIGKYDNGDVVFLLHFPLLV